MKVQPKDEIIKCLIDLLQSDMPESLNDNYIIKGWIEALMWVLNFESEQKDVGSKS